MRHEDLNITYPTILHVMLFDDEGSVQSLKNYTCDSFWEVVNTINYILYDLQDTILEEFDSCTIQCSTNGNLYKFIEYLEYENDIVWAEYEDCSIINDKSTQYHCEMYDGE